MKRKSQKMFSTAATKLEVLVTSTPRIGRNRKVDTMYGALHAMQKYVSKLVCLEEGANVVDSLGHP
jgi:hypothetical protein